MPRNCKIHIQISTGAVRDAESYYGFHLMESDDTVTAPLKDYEEQKYPESAAVEIYPYTTFKTFDYTCQLLAIGDSSTVNSSVHAFFDSCFEITAGVDLRKALPITIYNEWKGVRVTGYIKTNPEKGYYPKLTEVEKSAYLFELVLYVADPQTLQPWNG